MKNKTKRTVKYAFIKSLPVMAGYLLIGIGFGILMHSKGLGILWTAAMSVFVFAGSMQYVAVDLISGGASLISTAIMTLAVNARHIVYGISMIGKYKDTGKYKPYLIFALTDETYSIACDTEIPEDVDKNKFYFFLSLFNQFYWVVGSLLGSAVGNILPFSTAGIDFSMTALFVVVFINQWKASKKHFSSYLGVLTSVACLFIFGADSFIIPAMIVIVSALCLYKLLEKKEARYEQ